MKRYICPVCRSAIQDLPRSGLSVKAHLQIFLITGVLVGSIYLGMGPWSAAKAVLAYLPIWTIAEWVHWLRIREAARCRTCDFDPLLYRRDRKAARRRVEIKMQGLSEELQQRIHREITRIQDQRTASNAVPRTPEKSPLL